jgi:hypothetical protein
VHAAMDGGAHAGQRVHAAAAVSPPITPIAQVPTMYRCEHVRALFAGARLNPPGDQGRVCDRRGDR